MADDGIVLDNTRGYLVQLIRTRENLVFRRKDLTPLPPSVKVGDMKQKTFTVTVTANLHINANDKLDALVMARKLLPSDFQIIEHEVKISAEQDQE